jgi:hypothetical protein
MVDFATNIALAVSALVNILLVLRLYEAFREVTELKARVKRRRNELTRQVRLARQEARRRR